MGKPGMYTPTSGKMGWNLEKGTNDDLTRRKKTDGQGTKKKTVLGPDGGFRADEGHAFVTGNYKGSDFCWR